MKRFLLVSAVLALLIVALQAYVLPVQCNVCDDVLFRTNMTSVMFGGHGTCVHANCCPAFTHTPVVPLRRVMLDPFPEEAATPG